jgi:hypothetical protein
MITRSFDVIFVMTSVVVGLTTGWLIHGGAKLQGQPLLVKSQAQSERRNENKTLTTKTNNRGQAFATQFSKIGQEERQALQKNIAHEDRLAAIEALLAQGGPNGFAGDIEESINHLLGAWAEENFEVAWAWVQQLKGEGTQNFVARILLEKWLDTDPDRALSLYLERVQTNPNFESKVPEKVFAGAALKNAAEFLKFAGKVGCCGNNGRSCEFAKDFDFQMVADGIPKLVGRKTGETPSCFPRNFYEVWAERDREAAFKSLTGGELARVGEFDEFLEGLERHNPPEAVWDWVAKKIQESEVSSKAIRTNLANLQAVSFNGIIQALPDAASRDQFLMQIALEGGVVHQFDEIPSIAISAMSSPQVRLEAFSKMHQLRMEQQWDRLNIATITDADLQAWEITRQQVTAIFSAAEKKSLNSE